MKNIIKGQKRTFIIATLFAISLLSSGCATKKQTLSQKIQSGYNSMKDNTSKSGGSVKEITPDKYKKTKSWINKKSNTF